MLRLSPWVAISNMPFMFFCNWKVGCRLHRMHRRQVRKLCRGNYSVLFASSENGGRGSVAIYQHLNEKQDTGQQERIESNTLFFCNEYCGGGKVNICNTGICFLFEPWRISVNTYLGHMSMCEHGLNKLFQWLIRLFLLFLCSVLLEKSKKKKQQRKNNLDLHVTVFNCIRGKIGPIAGVKSSNVFCLYLANSYAVLPGWPDHSSSSWEWIWLLR